MTTTVWHSLDTAGVLKELDSDLHRGLTQEEVNQRLQKYGYNELKQEDRISPWEIFVGQFKNILIVILLIAIVLSALVGELIDAAIIGVIVVFSAGLGFTQ